MDVLNEDGTILCHKRWMGYGQIIVEAENPRVFHVLSVGASATDPNAETIYMSYACYEVTNVTYQSKEPSPLDKTDIRAIAQSGPYNPIQFPSAPNYSAIWSASAPVTASNANMRGLLREYNEILMTRNDQSLRVVFDNFTDPDAPIVTTPEANLPCTMEEDSVLKKVEPYTIKHICDLLGLRYAG